MNNLYTYIYCEDNNWMIIVQVIAQNWLEANKIAGSAVRGILKDSFDIAKHRSKYVEPLEVNSECGLYGVFHNIF